MTIHSYSLSNRLLFWAFGGILMIIVLLLGSASSSIGQGEGQQLAVPAYVHPMQDPRAWDRIIESAPGKVGIVVANVLNGPDYRPTDYWTAVIRRAHSSGIRVLGYVDTGYFGTTGLTTRLGTNSAADWMAQAQRDISAWYEFYGSDIDGIFFDQGQNACGPTEDSEDWVELYRHLNHYEKENHPGALTVVNPGTTVPQCYEDAADVLLTFESSYAAYVGSDPNSALNYREPDWVPQDPYKFWHIIYGASLEQMASVIQLSQLRHSGYVYVTDDVMENPYDSVPESLFWENEQALVFGTGIEVSDGAPVSRLWWSSPRRSPNLLAESTDFTSTELSWGEPESWEFFSPAVIAFDIYADGEKILSLPASTHRVRVGGLMPDTTMHFSLSARDMRGRSTEQSNIVTVTTLPLPDGNPLLEATVVRSSTSLTYRAKFLLPFSFYRVFISTGNSAHACWWTGSTPQTCADFVIENGRLLRYAGSDGSWTWELVSRVVPSIDGYSHSWTISPSDLGSVDGSGVATFNAEGYAPVVWAFASDEAGSEGLGQN